MDKSLLKNHLECSICMEIPSIGAHVYVCTRGHDICQNCFEQLKPSSRGHKICPSGRCPFAVPPVRNRTVEHIIEDACLESKCMNSKLGCTVQGSGTELEHHQDALCSFRKIQCLEFKANCFLQFYPKDMVAHLKTEHQNVVFTGRINTQKWLMKSDFHLDMSKPSSIWNLVVCEAFAKTFGIRFLKKDHMWYTWLVYFGEEDESCDFNCVIKVNHAIDSTKKATSGHNRRCTYTYSGRISSIRCSQEEIIANGCCLLLTGGMIRQCVTKWDISESSRRAGFDIQLPTSYEVTRCNLPRRRSSASRQPSIGGASRFLY